MHSSSSGAWNFFIQKVGPNGALLWAKDLTGNVITRGTGIETNALGEIFVTGTFNDSIDLDSGPSQEIYFLEIKSDTPNLYALKLIKE